MYIKPFILSLSLVVTPSIAAAQDYSCNSTVLANGMKQIEIYFRSADLDLFTVQMMLREASGHQNLQPDGKWGPNTYRAICRKFSTYSAINGESVYTQRDVESFSRWIISSTRASMNPNTYEYPD
jgi:hypothetical protein